MQKVANQILMLIFTLISFVFIATVAAEPGVQGAYNRCIENCVELNEEVCKQCCDKAFEPVFIKCRTNFFDCMTDTCKNDRRCKEGCYHEAQYCGTGAKGVHACP